MSPKSPASSEPALLRTLNRRIVLRTLRDSTSLETLAELAKKTGISRPTVEAALAELVERQWVEELAPSIHSTGRLGRPAKRFRFRNDFGILVGLDIGVHKILVRIADTRGAKVHEHRTDLAGDPARALTIELVVETVRAALREAGHVNSPIWALGCGLPGVVSADGVLARSVVVPDWVGRNIGEQLSTRLKTTVLVENDANLATLAEHKAGAAGGAGSAIVVTTGRRISAGLIIGNTLLRGRHGAAGEIGTLDVMRWNEAPGISEIGGFGQALGMGLSALVLAVDPEVVIIQGQFSGKETALLDAVRAELKRNCIFVPMLQLSPLGSTAVATGGVELAKEHFESQTLQLASLD
ncbi:ROK family protein [Pseudarthrobacter sp. P1]|uniref:ROK family transcriptional regulator n=1 Tax=Pseudarthrobacter sp. P1 TaxID=3418418 RepID=UPI003CECEB17